MTRLVAGAKREGAGQTGPFAPITVLAGALEELGKVLRDATLDDAQKLMRVEEIVACAEMLIDEPPDVPVLPTDEPRSLGLPQPLPADVADPTGPQSYLQMLPV